MTDEKTYSVGHKRPPQHTRFKAGQSGNPKGKAIGTLNLKNDLEQEFSERIPIREGDRSFRISKLRALLKATMAKGVNGDIRAANILFQLFLKTITPNEEPAGTADVISDDDLSIFDDYIARRVAGQKSKHVAGNNEEDEHDPKS
jgi:hypothetical protein